MTPQLRLAIVIIVLLAPCASCSYQSADKTETIVEEAVNKFHDDLNQGRYQKIYFESDTDLRNKVTEADFIAQLRAVHEQLGGDTSAKASVLIDDSVWRGLRQALGAKREIVSHGGIAPSNLIVGHEKFQWAVESDQPRLVSYEFRTVCRKPCQIGFQIR